MWVLKQNELNRRNRYAQVIGDLVEKTLRVLNEAPNGGVNFAHTEYDQRHKLAVVVVPPLGHSPVCLRVGRILDNETDVVQCILALGGTPYTKPVVEVVGPPIPLKWVEDGTSAA